MVYPVPGGKIAGGGRVKLPVIEDEELAAAKALVQEELSRSSGFPGATEAQLKRAAVLAEDEVFEANWSQNSKAYAFDSKTRMWVREDRLEIREKIEGLKCLVDEARAELIKEANVANRTEKKLNKLVGGYEIRSKVLSEKLLGGVNELERCKIELASFSRLETHEEGAAKRRVESLHEEVERLTRQGREGQSQYKVRIFFFWWRGRSCSLIAALKLISFLN